MSGVENVCFDETEKNSEEKNVNSSNNKEHSLSAATLVKVENSKKESSSEISATKNINWIVDLTLKIRQKLGWWFFGDNQMTKIFWIIFINGVAAAILIASIIHYFKKGEENIDWCDGVGILWILYSLTYFCIVYSLVKQFWNEPINNFFKPICKISDSLVSLKYFRWFCYVTPVLVLGTYVIVSPGKSGRRIYSFLGILVFTLFGYLFSKHPGHINWRPVICGMVLQFVFGFIAIRFETGKNILDCMGNKVTKFLQYTEEGLSFVYGYLGKPENNASPVFAFTVLPVVYFLSFFVNILSYYGALQWFIIKISWIVKVGMGTTVCESVIAAASIFLGMTEAPLLIRSYLKDLTKSELCAILCAGWSTVAGVVMAAYVKFGVKPSHLIAASIMSAPASLSFSKLFYPETEESKTRHDNIVLNKEEATNALDAGSKGALAGIGIVFGITANIIAFLAFVAFLDGMLIWIGVIIGFDGLSFQYVMSKIFYPVTFLMGVDVESLEDVAYLVGIKTVANEFQAYQMLGTLIKQNKLSERSEVIATYALCGFSNFGSIGVTIGAISSLEPKQASTAAEVALTAFIAANIVCFLTACVAGCLIE